MHPDSDKSMENSVQQYTVVLRSASPEDFGDIPMHGGLIPIGRYEPPFDESRSPETARMSRRHARIFVASDSVYIVDLGSSNGTTVNGAAASKEPVRLFNNDEVIFAGQFKYTVQIPETVRASSTLVDAAGLQLTLKPKTADLDTIVVRRFSFLVGKNSELFAPYREAHAKELSYLSRRHAHIFERDGELYIEDLGSTNGTYVNGQRLDEHARQISEGDVVGFGGDFLVYEVSIQNTSPPTESAAPPTLASTRANAVTQDTQHTERDVEAKTTFVSTASSFLEIFYDQHNDMAEEPASHDDKDSRNKPSSPASEVQRPSKRLGFFGRLAASIDELRDDSKGDGKGQRRWLPLAMVFILATGLAGTWFYLQGTPLREIKHLIETSEYVAAATKADTYLRAHPENTEVQRLANKALLNAVIPQWNELLQAGKYKSAHELLAGTASMTRYNADGRAMIGLLAWMTDLDSYHRQKENAPGSVALFEDEAKINGLIDLWDRDPDGHRLMLTRMAQLAPGFEPRRVQASSQLTRLYGERSEFLQVIKELKTKAMTYLASGQDTEVKQLISDFQQKYPSITGTAVLDTDYATYVSYRNAIDDKDVVALWKLSSTSQFSTPLFQNAADSYLKPELPSMDILKQYADARSAWQSGDVQGSRRILDSLTTKPWGDVATREIQEQTRVSAAFNALQQVRGTPAYDDQMLAFHALLNTDRDSYYIERIAADFETLREKILKAAQSDYLAANSEWSAYTEKGGITGLLRLEDPISGVYRQLATALSQARTKVQEALDAYQSVDTPPPSETTALQKHVEDEILRQQAWLRELRVVMSPSLLQQKLSLLPQI
jgi:pSer/pThr/pTyr-binding forkhead associated (FHA) protein